MNNTTFQIRRIDAAEARPLRHAILRPNQPFEATMYPLDDQPSSGHFGACLGDRLVGVASVFNEAMHACLDYIRAAGSTTLWFNARTTAAAFYSRFGFVVQGDGFDLPGIGPHVVMELTV